MINRRIIIGLAVTAVLVASAGACSKHSTKAFRTREAAASFLVDKINRGDMKAIVRSMVSRDDFIGKMYPHTSSGKALNALPGRDYWRIFMEWQRINGVTQKIKDYQGRIVSLESLGEPKYTFTVGPYQFYKKTPMTLKVIGDSGVTETIIDEDLLGVLVKDGERYMILNVFK